METCSEVIGKTISNAMIGGIILIVASNFLFTFKVESVWYMGLIYSLVPVVVLIICIIMSECCFTKGMEVSKKKGWFNCLLCLCDKRSELFTDNFSEDQYDMQRFGNRDYRALYPISEYKAKIEYMKLQKQNKGGDEVVRIMPTGAN